MTLMIASVRKADVVLTADGRSTTRTKGVVTGINDRYQKLYPVPDHPVVIGNLAENHLNGKAMVDFVADFAAALNAGDLSIEQIADELRRFAHPAVRRRLKAIGAEMKPRCGFWIVGFGTGSDEPRLVELFWGWKDDVLSCDERQFKPISVVEGGDGQKLIHPADWTVEKGKTVEEVRAYHKSLMDEAINAKVDANPVGGHVHELVITREEWKWTQPPLPAAAMKPTSKPGVSSDRADER